MFYKCFQNNCHKLFSWFQQNFLLHFHNYFNSPHNFPKIFCKNSFFFRHSSMTTFFYLTKITQHYFYKTCKIFWKLDGVSQTFSISSLKFLLKLTSHQKVVEHISCFPSTMGDLDWRFLSMGSYKTSNLFSTCLWTIAELCL